MYNKWVIRLLLIIIVAGVVGYIATSISDFQQTPSEVQTERRGALDVSPAAHKTQAQESLFVPYWSLTNATSQDFEEYDYLMYFGIATDAKGIDTTDPGYRGLTVFRDLTKDMRTYLTVRMVDSEVNAQILKDKQAQKAIISESVELAKEYEFDGIVLDFEFSNIGFEEVTNRVTEFYTSFSTSVKDENIDFFVTLYGDTYYRVRSYDVEKIAKLSDEVLIMAYDFHKARGNPGPNFPLKGKEVYGYDFQTMIEDFLKDVPSDKLTVIFGMFGYDWMVDSDKKTIGFGEGKSMLEIETSMVNTCKFVGCKSKRYFDSQEREVTYKDENGKPHIVWYEDQDSVKEKRSFLDEKGIRSISWWAYSYF